MKKIALVVCTVVLAACNGGSPNDVAAEVEPSATATITATEDARAAMIATAQAQLTEAAEMAPQLTADAQATQEAEHQAYLDEIVAPDLELAGYSLEEGQLWQPSFNFSNMITVDRYNYYIYDYLDYPNPVFSNFVLSLDVTWETEQGLAGCGVIFRAEDDLPNNELVRFNTWRYSGLPAWDIELWNFGDYQALLTGDIRFHDAINQGQGDTNHYVIVANGTTATVYANGEKLGSATLKENSIEGQIALLAWQQSGVTTCTFSNIWVWELPG